MFNGCKNLQYVSIPYTTKSLLNDNVSSYRRITLKGEWKSIPNNFLWEPTNKHNLKAIILESVIPPTINYFCGFFVNMRTVNNATIYVPVNSLSLYHNANVWLNYKDYIKPLSEYHS